MPPGGDTTHMYPPRVIEFARRLFADGEGQSINEIREALRKRGYTPKRDTIRYWVEPDYAEEKRRRARNFNPKGPAPRKAWRRRLERMQQLRDAGLSYRSIATVMSLDYEDLKLNEDQVRFILRGERLASTVRHLLWPKLGPAPVGRPSKGQPA